MKIHDILHNVMSIWVGNTACILAYFLILILGSILKSDLCSFPFFTILRTLILLARLAFMVALNGICLRLNNSCSLAFLSLPPLWEVEKPILMLGSAVMFIYNLCQIVVLGYWQSSFSLKLELRLIRIWRNHLVTHLTVLPVLGRRGALGDGVPDVLQSTTFSTSSSSVVQFHTFFQFLDKWRSITYNSFVHTMVKGHHLQLWCYPPWVNIKASTAISQGYHWTIK